MNQLIKKLIPKVMIKWAHNERIKSDNKNDLMWSKLSWEERQSFISLPLRQPKEINKVFGNCEYYSQVNQDFLLDNLIFEKKENGFFLDVGGNDPIYINNSYFFEKERNWDGIAFEPMPKMNDKWKECRRIECIQCALGSEEGEIEFCEYEDDVMSGFLENVDYPGLIRSKYTVKKRVLKNILKERGIKHVDFMSLDVEGAELDVLLGIDFDEVTIDYIIVENNKGREREIAIRNYLYRNGYKLIARLWIDEIWQKI